MKAISNQNGSSKLNHTFDSFDNDNFVTESKTVLLNEKIFNKNSILHKLEEDGFITPDEKAKELIKKLTEIKYLYSLKLLFENLQNEFSPQILRDSLVVLADPKPFDYYAKQSVARLELHLRTWVAVLERICFSPIRLSKELRDNAYNSLARFAEIHRKTTQVIEEGLENNFKPNLDIYIYQQDDKYDEKIAKKRNYNIDFLLIHLRDTLHSLRDDETWFQEILRRTKELFKAALNITPGVISIVAPGVNLPNDNCPILSLLAKLHQGLSFKYPVASYYIDWRIMLIIQNNIFTWTENENIINKKFGEKVLMEHLWGYLERELISIDNKSILDSQTKFEEMSNKVAKALRNTGSFLNDLSGNEPLALPHTLWFGILDIAQNLIQKSTQKATHGLCYYLAIESLNKAPSSFIQFKAIEVLLHLQNINNELFSMIELDFNQYSQKLNENNSIKNYSEKFQNLLTFVKEKYFQDFIILNENMIGNGKGKGKEQLTKSNILDIIVKEMICPISCEPTNQLCILKCQHTLSLDNLKKWKQKTCPECRLKIEDNDIIYLSQNSIYKNLYSQFFDGGHILPSIELENSTNQYDSDSNNSEVDLILTKKRRFIKSIKLNPNTFFQIKNSKKQHPTYQNIMKELDKKNYKKAEHWCKECLKIFPKSYSIRCILAYVYRCLNNYDDTLFYLKEAINLKEKSPIAYFIRGEIYFRQNKYGYAVNDLRASINYKAKMNNIYIILGNIYFLSNDYTYDYALKNYNIALQNDPNNYLCLKTCAYLYEKHEKYSDTLEMLDRLLSMNKEDSLILCYYGEILSSTKKYSNAISYFTKANTIDPENVHNLNKRAITYYILQEYDKALLDLNKATQLDPLNKVAYYYKWLTCYEMKNIGDAMLAFEKCNELDSWSYLYYKACKFIEDDYYTELGILNMFNKFMYEAQNIYLVSNLINLKNELYQFRENDLHSLSGYVLSFKDEAFNLTLPITQNTFSSYYVVWKINIRKVSKNCSVKFITKFVHDVKQEEHILGYEDLLKLKGKGWTEYKLPPLRYLNWIQPLIEVNGFIDMKIDYVQFIPTDIVYYKNKRKTQIYSPTTSCLSQIHNSLPNVPEAFRNMYFSRKEMENLIELKDITDNS